MPDRPTFQPIKPEQKMMLEVTLTEKRLIEVIRASRSFANFKVFKANGLLVRIETGDSILLNAE